MTLLSQITWCLKQLIPQLYISTYDEYKTTLVVWKMWLGHSYDIKHFKIESNV